MYYLSSENKGADQPRSFREADLRLGFSHMQIVGFPMGQLIPKTHPCNTLKNWGIYIYFILSSEINVYQKWIKVIFSLQN